MKHLFLLALLLLTPLGYASSELVILLSWDGMRHDFPDRSELPGLSRLQDGGIRTSLVPTTPSNTFPGHVTLATGTPPTVHGVLDNTMYDRNKGAYAYSADASWINAEPVWIAAERQGVKAATYFWVGSETDWQGQGQSYRIAPFDGARPESEKVKQMIEWIDLPPEERPGLILAYWRGADSVAHDNGPDHEAVDAIIRTQDEQLQVLLEALDKRDLWDTTTLIVTSDHGMAPWTRIISVPTILEDAGVTARVVGGTSVKRVFLQDSAQQAAALAALRDNENLQVYTHNTVPSALRFPNRTGDIVVTTEQPYGLAGSSSLVDRFLRWVMPITGKQLGAHGYDSDLPEMAAIFYAYGAGVTQGKTLPSVQQDQVAATVLQLLGLDPPKDAVGKALRLD